MNAHTIFLVDSDRLYLDILTHYLDKYPEFKIIGTACDGLRALAMIQTEHPEIVLMDILLPELDGLCLLKEMQKMKRPPLSVCLSKFYSPATIEQARKNGASYYVYKPAKNQAIATILHELSDFNTCEKKRRTDCQALQSADEVNRCVHKIMHSMGFSTKYSGSSYIAESVILAHEFPMMVRNLSTELYRELAQRMQTSPSRIERSMRTAIAAADSTGILTDRLGETPTNKRCIQYILNELNDVC